MQLGINAAANPATDTPLSDVKPPGVNDRSHAALSPAPAVQVKKQLQPPEEAPQPQPEEASEMAATTPPQPAETADSTMAKKRFVLLYGPPGSGRGTQTAKIAQRFGLANVCSGTVLKEQAAAGDALGLQAKQYMDRGEYVPDEIIMQVVMPQITAKTDGCVLSGFPRTREQAQLLKQRGLIVDAVIALEVPDWKLSERAVMRRRDAETGKVYHMLHDEAQITPEVRRRLVHLSAEDGEGNVEKRIALFRQNCAGVCAEFPATVVHRVDGDRHEEEVFSDICDVITGEASESAEVDYKANRSETVVKKLPWTLRSEFHNHGPEIEVDNTEFFDPDPDMHAKRKTGQDRAPLVILHFNDGTLFLQTPQRPSL